MLLQRRLPAYLAVAVFAFSAGVGAGWLRWKRSVASYMMHRSLVIHEHAQEMPVAGTLVIGDSIIERQRLGDICGPTLNAGISGATSADLYALVSDVIRPTRPMRVVFNVGINDVLQGVLDLELQTHVEKMIAIANGAAVLVVGVPGGSADSFLRAAAIRYGAQFIPYPVTEKADTIDGLHLNAKGAAGWQAAVRDALCPRSQSN
jgi:lysophospholipase L1-like esterase